MASATQTRHLVHHSPNEKAAQRDLDEAAYRLRCAENLTYAQVADRVHCDPGTAFHRCQRAEKRALASSTERCVQEASRHHERLLSLYAEALADYRQGHQVKQLRAALAVLDRIQALWRLDTIAPPQGHITQVNNLVTTLDPAFIDRVMNRSNPLPVPSLPSIAPSESPPTPLENTPPLSRSEQA